MALTLCKSHWVTLVRGGGACKKKGGEIQQFKLSLLYSQISDPNLQFKSYLTFRGLGSFCPPWLLQTVCKWLQEKNGCLPGVGGVGNGQLLLCQELKLTETNCSLPSKTFPLSGKPFQPILQCSTIVATHRFCHCLGDVTDFWCFLLCHLPRILLCSLISAR